MKQKFEALRVLLNNVSPIPETEWQFLAATLKSCAYAPGETIIRQGERDGGIHYLQTGLVRYYYLTEEGNERNHTFAMDGNLVGSLPVYTGTGPSTFTIEAIEATETLLIPGNVFMSLDERHECWLRLKLKLIQLVALRKERREAQFLLDSAEARYRQFLADYDTTAERIPQYHIASWLGITPVALSRIRKRIR